MAERVSAASVGRSESVGVGKTSEKQEANFNIVQITSEVVEDHLTYFVVKVTGVTSKIIDKACMGGLRSHLCLCLEELNLSVALAAAGVIVLARSVRLMTKFGAASEIPAWFVEKNVRLRGCVRRVTETGLQVEHVPIRVPLLSPLLGKRHVDGLLDVRLAGVDVAEEGRAWLRQNLMATDMVWLRLIRREADTVDCLVSVSRNMLLNTCVNEELLRLGLGKTVPITGLHYRSRLYWGLHKRLLRAEAQAERRGRGLWKRQSVWTRMMEATSRTAVARLFRKLLRRP